MLLGLLPGLRQLRAPLIAGVLYLLVAWVAFDGRSHLPSPDDPGGLGRIADLGQLVGPGATLAAAGLCGYLLGTFLTIRNWPQFLTREHWRSLRYALSGGEFSDWRHRQSPYNGDLFDPVWRYERADGLGTHMTVRRTHPWAGRLDNWVYRQADNLHRTFTYRDLKSLDPPDDFWGDVDSAWHDFREFLWRRANNEMEYRNGDWEGGLDQAALPEGVSMTAQYFDLRDDQVPPWEPTPSGWPENRDHDWWNFDRNLDEEVHSVVLSEAFLASLREERERVIIQLKAKDEVYFNEYDRAKSEAEMRYSAAVPILLLVAVLAVSWSPFALLGIVVPVLMVRQGLAIERAGFADLYLALQYAGIQSPTMALLYEARDLARRSKAATSDS